VATTLNQCHLTGPVLLGRGETVAPLAPGEHPVAAPDWLHHDGVAYLLWDARRATVRSAAQAGSWHVISAHRDDEPVTLDVLRLWIDHGGDPSGAAYVYAVAPGMAPEAAAARALRHRVAVLANRADCQAVRDAAAAVTGIAFYEPGRLTVTPHLAVAVDRPCLVLLREAADALPVTVSDPAQKLDRVTVTVSGGGASTEAAFDFPGGAMAGSSVSQHLPAAAR
jgi:chondroitin AC lyase